MQAIKRTKDVITSYTLLEAIQTSEDHNTPVSMEANANGISQDFDRLRINFHRHDIHEHSVFTPLTGEDWQILVYPIKPTIEHSTGFPTWAWLVAGFGILALATDIYMHTALSWSWR